MSRRASCCWSAEPLPASLIFTALAAAVACAALAAPPALAALIYVPGSFGSVGQALAAATPGDTVLVAPGTWPCSAALPAGVSLVGEAGGPVVLDAGGQGAVLQMTDAGSATCVSNVELTGGIGKFVSDSRYGGGLYGLRSSPTLSRVRITGCTAPVGGGAYFELGSPTMQDCDLDHNQADFGGGLAVNQCAVRLDSCTFTTNSASASGGGILAINAASVAMYRGALVSNTGVGDGGGAYFLSSSGNLLEVVLRDNSAMGLGGGISCAVGSSLSVSYDLFLRNSAAVGGAMYLACEGAPAGKPLPQRLRRAVRHAPGTGCSQVQALNNTFFQNSATAAGAAVAFNDAVDVSFQHNIVVLNVGGSGLFGLDLRSTLNLRCNDAWHNSPSDWGGTLAQGTNLSVNPMFCAPLSGVFTLCANSLLVDPACGGGTMGAYGVACDSCTGIDPVRPTTWGQLRRAYGAGSGRPRVSPSSR
jgi:hypothetical protein